MRRILYAISALLIALIIRLYPTLLSGLPFSTDAWSPIRNTELLLEYTPINLNDEVMDGYNCYWPANSLFGAILSLTTGIKPLAAMAFGIPFAGALTTLIFYVLVSRMSGSPELAFFSSILLATGCPYAIFTAGVTKETYANPIYVLSILIFLSRRGWREILLFTIASAALVLAHHLTALVAIAILACISLAAHIIRFRGGLSPDRSSLIYVSILSAITALYFGLYAYRGLRVTLTLSDWLSAFSYQILTFTLALYFAFKPYRRSGRRTALTCSMAAALVLFIALLCTKRSIIPAAPRLPSHYLLYETPFILIASLTALGYGMLREMGSECHFAPLFWLAVILGLEGYAVFGDSPFGLTLAYRTLNFLWPPLAIICGAGLHRLYYVTDGSFKRKLKKIIATVALMLIATLNSYSVYAAVSMQERYMGYFWLYKTSEYEAGVWIASATNKTVVAGDVKASYLLHDYFNVKVDVFRGLKYLAGGGAKPQTLLVYDLMLKNGYVLYGGYSVDLPENWTKKLCDLNIIYSNGYVNVYNG